MIRLFIITVTLTLLSAGSLVQADDRVPRDRLVTDGELIQLLGNDLNHSLLEAAGDQSKIEALGEYLASRSGVRYFFDRDDVVERVGAFAATYPAEVRRLQENLAEFERVYGADVDWMVPGTNRLGESHEPNVIRYLARQWRAPDFAVAHFLEGDARYLDFMREHVRDFIADYEAGRAQGPPNDVFERFYAGHRVRNWMTMHQLFRASSAYTPADEVYMLKVFLLHGARIYDQSRRFNWGNHQLVGLVALFELTTMYPELPVMHEWRQQALDLIAEHLEREVETDGFQFERASHYHLLDIINYFRTYQLAQRNDTELPDFFIDRFRGMFDAVVALAMPTREMPIIQDVSADFDVRSDPVQREMALGALLFRDPVYRYFAEDQMPADFYWLFTADELADYASLRPSTPELGSVGLEASHYYVMRTGWQEDDLYLLIDGGLARHKPDHTHGGVLGLIGYGFGHQFLPNYPVMYRHPSYQTLKNSFAKSVALADRVPQGRRWIDNKSRTGFGIFGELPQPTVIDWLPGESFDVFRASHDGYQHLGVTYEREIIFVKPHFWIVRDHFAGERAHSFQQVWQGAYEIPEHAPQPFRHSGPTYYVPNDPPTHRAVQVLDDVAFHVIQADADRMSVQNRRDYFIDSVEFEVTGKTEYTFTTLLYPTKSASDAQPRINQYHRPGEFEEIVVEAGDTNVFIYIRENDALEVERVTTDAGMVALLYEGDELSAVIMRDGTFLSAGSIDMRGEERVTAEFRRDGESWVVIHHADRRPAEDQPISEIGFRYEDNETAQHGSHRTN